MSFNIASCPIRAIVTGLFLFCTIGSPARAQRFDDVSFRADCAQIELAHAVGDKVSAEDADRCRARPKPPPPPPRPAPPEKGKPPSRDGFFNPPPPPADLPPPVPKRPSWLDGKGADGKILYGVGMVTRADAGATDERRLGMQRATFEIAAQIQTRIDSVSVDSQSAASVESRGANGVTRSASVSAQAFSSTTQLLVQASLEGLKFLEHYRDAKNGNYYVLASLDQGEIERKENEFAESVIEAMAAAAESVIEAFRNDTLSQELIFGLADAIDQANILGRSPMGRKVKDRWKTPQEQLLRATRRLASCVDVHGGFLEDKPTTLELTATCGGKVLHGARFVGRLEGGIADIPPSLVANAKGVVRFTPGTIYGKQTVKLTILHDLGGLRAAGLIGSITPSQRATLELSASEPALGRMSLVGLSDGSPEGEKLKAAVSGFVERKLGITVGDDGRLKVVVTVSMGSSVPVGAQTTQPIELNVTVTGPRGRLFDKNSRSAGLAVGAEDAKKQAFQRIIDGMRTW